MKFRCAICFLKEHLFVWAMRFRCDIPTKFLPISGSLFFLCLYLLVCLACKQNLQVDMQIARGAASHKQASAAERNAPFIRLPRDNTYARQRDVLELQDSYLSHNQKRTAGCFCLSPNAPERFWILRFFFCCRHTETSKRRDIASNFV